MASKIDIAKLSNDLSLKRYRFTLTWAAGGLSEVLKHIPDGWNEYEINYIRHATYHSVLRKGSELDLTFYKEGRDLLQAAYEGSGVEADVSLTVDRLDGTNNTYYPFPAPSKVSFAEYKINEVGVTVKLVDDGFKEKVFNRETTEVDVLKLVSIEGTEMAGFTVDTITMPDTSIEADGTVIIASDVVTDAHFVVPLSAATSVDFPEMQLPTTTAINIKTSSFFKESTTQRYLHLVGSMQMQEYIGAGGTFYYYFSVIDSDENVLPPFFIWQETAPAGPYGPVDIPIDVGIALNVGDSILLQCQFNGASIQTNGQFTVNETYTGNPEKEVTALMDYEMFLRISQLITDQEDCFYSEFFGRTDTPITVYDADGELGACTRGILFRLPYYLYINRTISTTLKEYFEAKSAQFRLGLSIEDIGDPPVQKIRIEEMDYFFDENVVLDLSSRLREEDIGKEIIPERIFKSLNFGYDKFEYLSDSGLLEFNTKSSWSTVIKAVFTELKQICKLRADGQGMRLLLNAPSDIDYEVNDDFKGDDDLFLIDIVRDGADLIARTDEGFDYIGGAVYAASSFNVRWSPARNLLRWGEVIKSGLTRSLSSLIRWQTTDKNTTLESRLSTEAETVSENADIEVDSLNNCRWLPEKYNVKVPLTNAELNLLDASPNKLIKLADTKFGWILDAKLKIQTGLTEFNLLKCDLDNVTPIE